MRHIADWIDRTITAPASGDEAALAKIDGEVKELTAKFPRPGCKQFFSFRRRSTEPRMATRRTS